MKKSFKAMIKEFLAEKGFDVISFSSLPDRKIAHTSMYGLGFYGSISARSWGELYLRVRKEFKQ